MWKATNESSTLDLGYFVVTGQAGIEQSKYMYAKTGTGIYILEIAKTA
jgi:hypothetical protein